MKKYFYFAAAALALASCASDEIVQDPNAPGPNEKGAISFTNVIPAITRGEITGATAAEKLGGMFVVEGTKGSEQTNSPSTTPVFDNYLVGYTANTQGTSESNTNNWEYVGLHTGITNKLSSTTWNALHPTGDGVAVNQAIKFWDYTTTQYDFIAWSTGAREAVTTTPTAGTSIQVTRIATGTNLSTSGFQMTALSAADLQECYFTDITTVTKASNGYGNPVKLTFKNMASKVRVALYETIPGYSVKDVKFYTSDANPTAPTDLGTNTTDNATLFTMGTGVTLPQSGVITVYYPHIGTTHRDASSQTKDYNKASVTTAAATNGATSTTQAFGALTNQYRAATGSEKTGDKYLGTTLPTATYAGSSANSYYTAVIPNSNPVALTLRVDYTLVSTDGVDEEIKVYGAKAVVPATYTNWQPNYAYTYVFKISDNTNGWTSTTNTDPQGLYPITFDAVVTEYTDANAEQSTITTVATPSITTYQQGHTSANNEYKKSQTAGVSTEVKDVYVQVMDNSVATPTLVANLNGTGKSALYSVSKTDASEAEVIDALENRTNAYTVASPVGRNGITLTTNANIDNTVTSIINGVDDQPITKIAGTDITAGQVAKIDIDQLAEGTYAYVYATTVPSSEEKVYALAVATDATSAANYYEVAPESLAAVASNTAEAGKVYFIKTTDAVGGNVVYTFKQTKVGDDVTGCYEATIGADKATTYTAGNFYFDVYNRNNGQYAVKVIKVVD